MGERLLERLQVALLVPGLGEEVKDAPLVPQVSPASGVPRQQVGVQPGHRVRRGESLAGDVEGSAGDVEDGDVAERSDHELIDERRATSSHVDD